jgi:hypothetical protein
MQTMEMNIRLIVCNECVMEVTQNTLSVNKCHRALCVPLTINTILLTVNTCGN